ncbi:MAG TPA: Fe-S protein assembly co-chaperone HscB [Bryobacteraceae bacterium]|nr:Fe-S protein assembly co-chaperone HscB [Bryobacteraceae bacterium]
MRHFVLGMTDYYTVFDLPRTLAVDTEELQKRFYARTRQWHPDRFGSASADKQAEALEITSALNDGYRVLRDPLARAEYLLSLEGLEIATQRSDNVPPELLEEVFELNEMLEDAAGNREELAAAQTRFQAMLERVDCDLAHEFEQYDTNPDRSVLLVIRSILNRRRYIQNLLRDVHQALAS